MDGKFEWYVVQTFSGYEAKVKANIEKTIETHEMTNFFNEIRIPVEEITQIRGKKKKTVQKKVYPGYVFIKMILNDETWHIVRGCRGVTSFVGPESKPLALTEPEIKRLGNNGGTVCVVRFKVGDNVVVNDGALEGFVGTVEKINLVKEKVAVKLNIFQRETEVELNFGQVEVFVD